MKTVILVGGPTYSPILRRMVKEQISGRIDYSIDPMTVVARGAALYASTIAVSEEIRDETRNRAKIQLEIKHEPMTVELDEFVTVKILRDKTDGAIPDVVFAEFARTDKAWTGERLPIGAAGEMFEVKLDAGKVNIFNVNLFDDKGNRLTCEPEEISIIQGSVVGGAPVSYSFGIEIRQKERERDGFSSINGLEKNALIPASGTTKKLQTQTGLRRGVSTDEIRIPLYEGEDASEGSRAVYNDHVYDFVITGEHITGETAPESIPSGSEVQLSFIYDGNSVECKAHFPEFNLTVPLRTPETVRKEKDISLEFIEAQLGKANSQLAELQGDFYADSLEVDEIAAEIDEITDQLEKSGFETDTRNGALDRLRKCFRRIDKLTDATEWNNLQDEILKSLARLEQANEESGNARSTRQLIDFQRQSEKIIQKKDVALGRELLQTLDSLFFALTWREQTQWLLQSWNEKFDEIDWNDRANAWRLLNDGRELARQNAEFEQLRPAIAGLFDLLPEDEKEKVDKSLLLG